MRYLLLISCAALATAWCGHAPAAWAGEGCPFCQNHAQSKCDGQCDGKCSGSCDDKADGDCGKPLCSFSQHKCHCPLQDCCFFYHLDRNNYGAVDSVNCSCNGSYKFPVPPLYTYHWPGRFSLQLMTDYQSPWRFPPLKPYTEEPTRSADLSPSGIHNVSYETKCEDLNEPISAKIARMYANP